MSARRPGPRRTRAGFPVHDRIQPHAGAVAAIDAPAICHPVDEEQPPAARASIESVSHGSDPGPSSRTSRRNRWGDTHTCRSIVCGAFNRACLTLLVTTSVSTRQPRASRSPSICGRKSSSARRAAAGAFDRGRNDRRQERVPSGGTRPLSGAIYRGPGRPARARAEGWSVGLGGSPAAWSAVAAGLCDNEVPVACA